MAQTTPNFGFNIAEGTDTVNLLTQCYPNFTSLDSILQGIKETGVTTAVATKTGTNFAVVRTDTDCNFFRFIATANYAAGDTFTVDGVSVTATSPAGTALPAGAFVINQSVIGVVNSSVLTLFVGGGSADAADITYDNTGSGLTAATVQAAIDEVVSDIPTGFAATAITYDNSVSGLTAANVQSAINELAATVPSGAYVSVTPDGVKTRKQLLDQLFSLIDGTKVKESSYFIDSSVNMFCRISRIPAANDYILSGSYNAGTAYQYTVRIRSGASGAYENGTDMSSQVPTLGDFKFYY